MKVGSGEERHGRPRQFGTRVDADVCCYHDIALASVSKCNRHGRQTSRLRNGSLYEGGVSSIRQCEERGFIV